MWHFKYIIKPIKFDLPQICYIWYTVCSERLSQFWQWHAASSKILHKIDYTYCSCNCIFARKSDALVKHWHKFIAKQRTNVSRTNILKRASAELWTITITIAIWCCWNQVSWGVLITTGLFPVCAFGTECVIDVKWKRQKKIP